MKKIYSAVFFFPAVTAFLLYSVLNIVSGPGSIEPSAWVLTGILFVSAFLLVKGRSWGCFGGVLTGLVLICMGTRYTGQIINEGFIGIVFIIYYLFCGLLCHYRLQ